MLKTLDLTKEYNGRNALDALNLNVEPGDVYCLLGANGAGKTTTINLLLNFVKPTDGENLLDAFPHLSRDNGHARPRPQTR